VPIFVFYFSLHFADVEFFEEAAADYVGHFAEGEGVFGEDDEAAGVAIEAVAEGDPVGIARD